MQVCCDALRREEPSQKGGRAMDAVPVGGACFAEDGRREAERHHEVQGELLDMARGYSDDVGDWAGAAITSVSGERGRDIKKNEKQNNGMQLSRGKNNFTYNC